MASIIKADNIQKVSDGTNIIKKCGSTITLGSCGATIALACGATQTGFGRTGTVDWCTTAKTAPFTGVSGKGYFVNTTCGAVTVTLPASPSAGDIISIADYASTWQTNAVTICRNSSKINGGCFNATLNTEGQSITLVYVDGTRGWKNTMDSTSNVTGAPNFVNASGGTIVTCGDYKTHIFTSSGTFTVNGIAPAPSGNPNALDYFVVAGGGGGGGGSAGGGGAGGFRVSNCAGIPAPTMSPLVAACGAITATATSYPITIGAGGAAGTWPFTGCGTLGTSGSNSIFSTVTSTGGGGGGAFQPVSVYNGLPGGSGGGGTGEKGGSGGTGNTPPTSPSQGNNGGTGGGPPSPRAGAGGGGAGAVGTPGTGSQNAGPGGVGSFIADGFIGATAPSYGTPGPVGSTRYFSGGGGAGTESTPALGLGSNGAGGDGGGGGGGPSPTSIGQGTAGTTNTGGGGGGASRYDCGSGCLAPGGAGGSGIIMIRYKYQ